MSVNSALENLLIEHRAPVERYVRRQLTGPEADDVLQKVWMRAFERVEQLRDPQRALGWLLGIARHAVLDERRRVQRERDKAAHLDELLDGGLDSALETTSNATSDWCDCSLDQMKRLSSAQSAVLERVVVQGDSVTEAAEALGISPGSVSVRLFRARERLRTLVMDHCKVSSLRETLSCHCLEAGCSA